MTFEELRVVDLKSELKSRGLPVSGLKAVLVQRLEEHERSQGAVEGAQTAAASAAGAGAGAGALVNASNSGGLVDVGVNVKEEGVYFAGKGDGRESAAGRDASTLAEIGTASARSENTEKIPPTPAGKKLEAEVGRRAAAAAERGVVVTAEEEAVLSGDDFEAASTTASTIPTTAADTSAAPEGGVEGGGGDGGVGGRAWSSRKSSRRVSTSSATLSSKNSSSSSSSSSAADAAATAVYGAPTPELQSTRSETRRAPMAPAAHAAAAVDPAPPLPPLKEASVVEEAGSKAGVGVGGFDGPERHVRLGAVVAASSVAVSAACIAAGDGLTVGNLASLHVSLGAVFISGLAANKGANLWQACATRVLATAAFVFVALEGYKQDSTPGLADPMAGMGLESEMAAGAEAGRDVNAEADFAGGGVGGGSEGSCGLGGGGGVGEGGVSCSAEVVVEAVATAAVSAVAEASKAAGVGAGVEAVVEWVGGVWEGFEAREWREVRLGVEEFWGWASVAAYLALVEALPVLLSPLHRLFRKLERLHNTLLALTSLAMLVGIVRASVTSGKTGSIHALLCTPFREDDWVFDLTSKVFFWSKAWEWFDTALLVAKGKPVSWLQYSHHASTGFLTSLNMVPTPNATWSVVCATNSFVHAWMYGYYALPRSHPLRRTRIWLTRVQMVQHVTVLVSAVYVLKLVHDGVECYNNTTPIYAGLGLYLVYFVFFALFYRRTYGGGGGGKKSVTA